MYPLVILHVTAPASVGGLERVVQGLASGHAARGHTVHVAAVGDAAGTSGLLDPLRAAGVTCHVIDVPARGYFRERRLVGELCDRIRPAVVHTHGYRPDLVDAGVARERGIATATTVHGFTGGDLKNRLYEGLQVRAFRRFDAVVAVSRRLQEQLAGQGVSSDRLRMIVNAWTPRDRALDRPAARAALGLPADEWIAGFVGRLDSEKGPDVALEALALAGQGHALSLIGEGRLRPMLEQRAAAPDLAGRIRFHGMVPDAGRLLAAFDAFVMSSRTEGTPIALFEAMAAGIPIVASRVGGIPDVVSDAEAWLVPNENPAAIAAALREMRSDAAGARLRAGSARDVLERRFAAGPWLASYESLYREIAHVKDAR